MNGQWRKFLTNILEEDLKITVQICNNLENVIVTLYLEEHGRINESNSIIAMSIIYQNMCIYLPIREADIAPCKLYIQSSIMCWH